MQLIDFIVQQELTQHCKAIIFFRKELSNFDARYWMLGAGALGLPRGMVWGGRREEGSGWGTHVYLWRIHFDIWQNQYNTVKFKNKIKLKKRIDFSMKSSTYFTYQHSINTINICSRVLDYEFFKTKNKFIFIDSIFQIFIYLKIRSQFLKVNAELVKRRMKIK